MKDILKITVNSKIMEFTKKECEPADNDTISDHLWWSFNDHFNAVYHDKVMHPIPYDWSRKEILFLIHQMIGLYIHGQQDGMHWGEIMEKRRQECNGKFPICIG